MVIAAVLLAAGRATRYGSDKRLALLASGEPMAIAAGRALVAASLAEVIAVIRPDDDALAARFAHAGVQTVRCERADEGMGASLACGIAAVPDAGGWLVALADMPWVASSTIARVADALRAGASIAAPFWQARRGHPVGFAQRHRQTLLALAGDEGARALLAAHATSIERVDVDDPAVLRDVDVPPDLRA